MCYLLLLLLPFVLFVAVAVCVSLVALRLPLFIPRFQVQGLIDSKEQKSLSLHSKKKASAEYKTVRNCGDIHILIIHIASR